MTVTGLQLTTNKLCGRGCFDCVGLANTIKTLSSTVLICC